MENNDMTKRSGVGEAVDSTSTGTWGTGTNAALFCSNPGFSQLREMFHMDLGVTQALTIFVGSTLYVANITYDLMPKVIRHCRVQAVRMNQHLVHCPGYILIECMIEVSVWKIADMHIVSKKDLMFVKKHYISTQFLTMGFLMPFSEQSVLRDLLMHTSVVLSHYLCVSAPLLL